MALVIARSRRFDRFQEPVLGHVELPAELQHKLVWLVAAALRHYIVQQHGLGAVDGVIEEAAGALIAAHDEGAILEAAATRLAQRLAATGRLDGALLRACSSEGLLPLFIAGAGTLRRARTCRGLGDDRRSARPRPGHPAARRRRRARGGRRDPAPRQQPAARSSPAPRATPPPCSSNCYDSLDRASAAEVLRLWRAAPGYRAAVARVSTRARPSAEAA